MDYVPVPHNDGWIMWFGIVALFLVVMLLAALVAFAWCVVQHLRDVHDHLSAVHRKLSSATGKLESLERHRARHARGEGNPDTSPEIGVESPAPITQPGPAVSPDGPPTVRFQGVSPNPVPPPIRQFR